MQPLSPILKLNISGKLLDVRASTLCHVPGSALEAFFSGRHELQRDDEGRIFVDRNFEAFNAVVDLIRNGGRVPGESGTGN